MSNLSNLKKSLVIATCLASVSAPIAQAETILFKNAKVHTLGSQGTLNEADVLLEDGKIAKVGKNLGGSADKVIEAKGKVITPGIFAVANNLGVVEISALEQTFDGATQLEGVGASFSLDKAFNPNSTLIPHNRVNGVTRTLIAPAYGNQLLFGQASIMSLSGDYEALIKSKVAIFGVYGEGGSQLSGGSRATALQKLQLMFDEAREFQTNKEAILKGNYRDLKNSLADLQALTSILNRNIPLVIDVQRANDILAILDFARSNNLRLVLKGAAEAWMVADKIAKANVPVILDPSNNIPRSFESLGQRIDNATLLDKAGVSLIFNGQTHNAHTVRHAAGLAVSYGLPYDKALKAMTVTPARIFGGSSNYGKILPGYSGELVLWDGDPLEVTSLAEQVVIAGKLVSMTSRAKRLRERYQDISSDKNTAYRK